MRWCLFLFHSYPVYCQQYAKVVEAAVSRNTIICGGEQRVKGVYLSTSHEMELQIMNRRTQGKSQYFLFKYEGNISLLLISIHYRHTIYGKVEIFLHGPHSIRADSRFAPSQRETALLCNDVSNWLDANIKPALSIDHNARQ